MSDRNISNMIEAIRGQSNKSDTNIMIAQINSVSPLTLTLFGKTISKNIYIDPSLSFEASGGESSIDELFTNAPLPSTLFDFLKEFHKRYIIKQGDTVIVIQSGVSFYIVEKAVKVS